MVISAAASTSDMSILPPLFTLGGAFVLLVVAAILGKTQAGSTEKADFYRTFLQKQMRSTQNIKERGKKIKGKQLAEWLPNLRFAACSCFIKASLCNA